jgi:DNA adenine methylase
VKQVVPVREQLQNEVAPTPFVKWVGGKGKLLEQITPHLPSSFGTYHEPFVGGGALFFHLRPARAVLSDVNPRLVECYRVIRDRPWDLVERLEQHRAAHDENHYYFCRDRLNRGAETDEIERSALFIYLNKTCYNGLYRENRRGEFNVPVGRYDSPSVYDVDNLLAVSRALSDTEILHAPFSDVLERARPGDLVYFDPPYVPVSRTASFTGYVQGGFDDELQAALSRLFANLARRGVHVALSNSDAPLVRELYRGFRIETILAARAINSRASARGPVREVLVLGA